MSFEHQSSAFLDSTQQEYPSIAADISEALRQAPIFSELRSEHGWTDEYANALERVKDFGYEHGVCDHGWEHLMHVSKSTLLLGKIARDSVKGEGNNLAQAEDWDNILAPASLMYVVLKSDLHYGDPDVQVEHNSVLDHAARSAATIEKYREPIGDQAPEAHAVIHQNFDMFYNALSFTLEDSLEYAKSLQTQTEPITPQQLFVLIPKVADMFDLYRASRVRHVVPENNQNNSYYQLSQAVSGYRLSCDETNLTYGVQLKPNAHIHTSEGLKPIDFHTWHDETKNKVNGDRDYGQVWELLQIFAKLLGKNLVVEEIGYNSPDAPEHLSNLSAYTIANC